MKPWKFELLMSPPAKPLTEGPVWDGKHLYFTHIQASRILRYDLKTNDITVAREDTNRTNGLCYDAQGRLFGCCSGGRSIVRFDPDGTTKTITDNVDGKKLNTPNDLAVDRQGRIWFTNPVNPGNWDADSKKEIEDHSVLRADPQPDGTYKTTRVTFDTTQPNGILISQDLLDRLDRLPDGVRARALGTHALRGRGGRRRDQHEERGEGVGFGWERRGPCARDPREPRTGPDELEVVAADARCERDQKTETHAFEGGDKARQYRRDQDVGGTHAEHAAPVGQPRRDLFAPKLHRGLLQRRHPGADGRSVQGPGLRRGQRRAHRHAAPGHQEVLDRLHQRRHLVGRLHGSP